MELRMTNNEYQEFIKVESGKLWNRIFAIPGGSKNPNFEELRKNIWKEFNEVTNNVDIIPFNINTTNKVLESYIQVKCCNESIKEDHIRYEGRSNNANYRMINDLNLTCICDTGYSSSYYNDIDMVIFSYCEGDITFQLYTDKEAYKKEVNRIEKFYELEY